MDPKIAVIVYHKNIRNIYPQEWIDQFVGSIERQSYQKFDILEINYGGVPDWIFKEPEHGARKVRTFSYECINFVEAMNCLMTTAVVEDYDYVFNTNCDDYYSSVRIEVQLKALREGYDLVSSNFHLINSVGHVITRHRFHKLDLREELWKHHNIICHPVVAYSRNFISNFAYDPREIPEEDLKLWLRAFPTMKFKILEADLCGHRIHANSVCVNPKRR